MVSSQVLRHHRRMYGRVIRGISVDCGFVVRVTSPLGHGFSLF